MRKLAKLVSLTLAFGSAAALAADPSPNSTMTTPSAQGQAGPDVDNTGMNVRDKGGATKTPQKQANRPGDRKLVEGVRRAVVRDKTLSTSGHNVKIVASGGVVTLRGPVRSEDEKAKIETLAQHVAGVASVENQLDVQTK